MRSKILLTSLLLQLFFIASCGEDYNYSKRSEDQKESIEIYNEGDFKKLLSPTNIVFDEDTLKLSWDAVDGAYYYAVNVNGKVIVSDCEENSYQLNSDVIDTSKESEFLISIRAISEDKSVKSSYASYLYDISSSSSTSVFAYSLNSDGNTISIDGFNPLISYKEKSLTIYSELGGLKVTKISDYAFKGNSNLTEITIPSSIEEIGVGAFYQTFITTFNLNEGLKYIDDYAFYNSYRATSFSIPSSVLKIGDYSFYKVIATKINFNSDSNLTSIGAYAFANCTKFKTFELPAKVNYLGEYAFSSTYMSTLTFAGNELTYLPDGCFASARLTSFTLPSFITSIGKSCFEGAIYLTKFYYDAENLEVIPEKAFYNTKALKLFVPTSFSGSEKNLLILPSSIKEISSSAFEKTIFSEIRLNENLEVIGKSAFANQSALTSITLPSSLISIGETAFSTDKALTEIIIPETNNLTYIGIDAFKSTPYLTNNASKRLILGSVFYQASSDDLKATTLEIPSNVKSIAGRAFYKAALTSISLPESLIDIGENAFASSKLTSISFPSNIENIGANAFENCTSLANVSFTNLDNGIITSIPDYCFKGDSKLKDVNLPSSITSIGNQAFYVNSSYSNTQKKVTGGGLIENIILPEKLEVIADEAFSGQSKLNNITFPNSLISIGKKAFYNNASLTNATLDIDNSKLEVIGESAFENANLESFAFPSSISEIATKAFNNNPNLSSLDFNKDANISEITAYSFANLNKLSSITLPSSVNTIVDNAFLNDENLISINCEAKNIDRDAFKNTAFSNSFTDGMVLYNGILLSYTGNETEIIIPEGVSTISSNTFKDSNITKVTLPDSLEIIEESAFEGAKSLIEVSANTESSKLRLIEKNAFKNCTSLISANLSNTLESIGEYAFYGNISLTSIKFDSDALESIGSYAFANDNGLENVIFGSSLKSIGEYAFYQCSLVIIDLPSSINNIGSYAFANNGKASNINLDSSNWEISPSLTNININSDSQLSYVGEYAFSNNLIESITIPDNDGLIFDKYSLANSVNLKQIDIPSGVIFKHASLYNASSLNSISLDSTLLIKSLFGGYVSMVPTSLNEVKINEGSISIDESYFAGLGMVKNIEIPDSVNTINDYAFYGCRSISSINLKGVSYIGKNAFNGCVNLDNINFGNKLDYIGDKALFATGYLNNKANEEFVIIDDILIAYNGNEASVTLADNIKVVAGGAFSGNHDIESLTLGSNTSKLCNGAFDSCSKLNKIILTYNGLVEIELEIFDSLSSNLEIQISSKQINLYKDDVYWSLYEDNIKED